MTQSPDYEFGITEKEMLDLGNCISSEKGHWILKTVRSRKHSPPSGRDKVLDKFAEVIRLHDEDELLYPDLYNEFLVIYKSLRTPKGGPK